MIELRPIGTREACAVVKSLHRKHPRVVGGLFATSVFVGGELVGVGIASVPKAPANRDGFTVEISRIATDGHPNACSKLYGALLRASAAVGFRRAITFTALDEPGTSLRAAGFVREWMTREQSWDRPRNPREKDLSQVWRWSKLLQGPRAARARSRSRTGMAA